MTFSQNPFYAFYIDKISRHSDFLWIDEDYYYFGKSKTENVANLDCSGFFKIRKGHKT